MKEMTSPNLLHYQWELLQATFDWICPHSAGDKRRKIESTYSPHYTADWVQQGRICMSVGSRFKTVEAKSGEWIFRRPGSVFVSADPGSIWISVGFSLRWTGAMQLLRSPRHLCWKTGPLLELESKTNCLREAVREKRGRDGDYDMILEKTDMYTHFQYGTLFHDWLMTWEEEMRKQGMGWSEVKNVDEKVVSAVRYLEELSMEHPVDVAGMARSIGISTRHLGRLFHREYGMGPKAYRMKLKLRQAVEQLQSTRDEIKEVASRMGCDPTWFGVWIKKETGKTPSQVRGERINLRSIPMN